MLKKLIFLFLRLSCLHIIVREFFQKDKVTIVYFHEIPVQNAEKILSYYKKKFNIISLENYVNHISNKSFDKIPKKALIITIDDGLKQNYDLFSVISNLKIPITIFLVSGIVATKKGFWWNHNYSTYTNEDLKNFKDKKRLKILEENGFIEDKPFNSHESLSSEEINKMKSIFNFQSHSVSHPILTQCDSKKSKIEIHKSRKDLQSKFDLDIFAFAFPNGNFSEREISFVQSAGYRCALNTINGFNSKDSNLFYLKRISAGTGTSLNETIFKSSGLWIKMKNLFHFLG